MTRAGLLALALVAAAAGAARADEPRRFPLEQHSTLEVAPSKRSIPAVVVDNPLGDVRIEGHDGPGLVIITTKRGPDDETLARLRVSLVPDPDGTVRLSTAVQAGAPIPKGTVRIDLVIRAPRDARIDGRVGNGTLQLANMDAGGELDVARGRIEVKNVAGPVIAHTVDAPLSMSEVFGAIDAQVLTGDVRFDTVRGDRLTASVHRGRIDGRRVRSRDVELTTTSGDVAFEGEAPLGAMIRIASLSGSIDVRLRASAGLVVRARGRAVDLERGIKGDDGVYTARFGRGNKPAKVELRTRLGSLKFAFIE